MQTLMPNKIKEVDTVNKAFKNYIKTTKLTKNRINSKL
jgi:hypothetical protein